ncbi:MAG: DNA-protecting protein DprA, partial [Firmicutes bacterium]|nr:DNA-protecting protein DprA [Bacillota bacterium]
MIEMIKYGERAYPAVLTEIKNPPKELYYTGDLKILDETCAAVVGSRTTTAYGRNTANAIGRKLAGHGVTVVSGMAMGIDTCAHEGALDANGSTVAVLGCGIDICYPPENKSLKAEIERKGLVLSEYPPGTPADRYNFPNRNRIISGLSAITVVVQARNRSGAMITAECAAEQGREVLAVPGNIDSQYNLGNNKLIKEGAMPVISI